MIHKLRNYNVKEYFDLDVLVKDLTERSWCLCCGFRWRSLTLLNDAFSEDGAQEFAVLRDGHEIESLTISWMKPDEVTEALTRLDAQGSDFDGGQLVVRAHPPGSCRLCA